jgi:hypothetical protein
MTNTTNSKSMSKSHVIRVPGELVEGWVSGIWHEGTPVRVAASDRYIADKAAQWGWDQREPELQERADQEVDACCEWLTDQGYGPTSERLRAARRPKQLSLAEQGMEVVRELEALEVFADLDGRETGRLFGVLEEALDRLAELENQQ